MALRTYSIDQVTRAAEASISLPSLKTLDELHKALCHPGITTLFHYVKIKNLPFSFDDVKNVVKACTDCSEVKVKFLKPKDNLNLIKATKPFERISLDFKGPLPTTSGNKYMLVIIDEYSRFPFVYACENLKASTIIEKLNDLFCMFGLPSNVHTDQGTNFMSYEFKSWLHSLGDPTSRTTRYNPRGNGQVERYNGIIWKTIVLALRAQKLSLTHWEYVLPIVLHSIRSLLCTTTNCTPHKRMFRHDRKSFNDVSLPSWVKPGPIYVKNHNRNDKSDLLVEEAELLEANPQYAYVRLEDGRETPVSLQDLAPKAITSREENHLNNYDAATETSLHEQNETVSNDLQDDVNISLNQSDSSHEVENDVNQNQPKTPENKTQLRRSLRVRHAIERYGDPGYY